MNEPNLITGIFLTWHEPGEVSVMVVCNYLESRPLASKEEGRAVFTLTRILLSFKRNMGAGLLELELQVAMSCLTWELETCHSAGFYCCDETP